MEEDAFYEYFAPRAEKAGFDKGFTKRDTRVEESEEALLAGSWNESARLNSSAAR